MMRLLNSMLAVAVAATAFTAEPVGAKEKYYYADGDHRYSSHAECERKRTKAAKRGTVIGAAGAGAGTALLGGNLGASLLGAGVGAVAGNAIGRGTEKTCNKHRY